MHVVGPSRGFGQQGVDVSVTGLGFAPVEMPLLAEQSDQPATALVGVQLVVGDDVAHPGLLMVGLRTAERGHVHVLAGDAAHHVGPGDEHPAFRCHDDDVGQRRPVGGAAGGEADDHRDLRNVARRANHGLEHRADRVQRPHTFGQPGATGVPDADDRALLLDGGVVGVDDVLAAFGAHRAAHDGAVRAEGNCAHTVHGAGGGQYSRAITLVQQFDAVVVEEVAQTQEGVAGVERLANRLGGHRCHRRSPVSGGDAVRVSTDRRRSLRCGRRIRTSC